MTVGFDDTKVLLIGRYIIDLSSTQSTLALSTAVLPSDKQGQLQHIVHNTLQDEELRR